MTQDDLNAIPFASANIDTGSSTQPANVEIEFVDVSFVVSKAHWDSALASAADALVLVTWLESKRT